MLKKRAVFFSLLAMLTAVGLLLAGCGQPAEVDGENRIVNGGFDLADQAGQPQDWQFDNYNGEAEPPPTYYVADRPDEAGNPALYLQAHSLDDARLVQTVAVTPNRYYKLSGWVNGQVTQGTGGIWLAIENTFVGTQVVTDTQQEWVYVEAYLRAVSGQKSVNVMARIGGYGADTAGSAWFDDIVMVEVTQEEATAAASGVVDMKLNTSGGSSSQDSGGLSGNGAQTAFTLFGLVYLGLAVYFVWRNRSVRLSMTVLVIGLAAAAILRVLLAAGSPGYQTDINCWWAWGNSMLANGPFEFYNAVSFCDYPPLYMMVLAIPVGLMRLLGLDITTAGGLLLIKLPQLVADMLLAYMAYKLAARRMSQTNAILVSLFVAFNPMLMYCSAVWGQIDSVFLLPLVVSMYYLTQRKYWQAGVMFGLSMLVKSQAIIFLPALAWPLLCTLAAKWRKRPVFGFQPPQDLSLGGAWGHVGISLGCALGTILVGFLPAIIGTGDVLFPIRQYASAFGTYSYYSLNALNLFTLLGLNGVSLDWTWLGAHTTTVFTVLCAAVASVISLLYCWAARQKSNIFMSGALVCITFFMFSVNMHERYIIPGVVLLILAFIYRPDRRLLPIIGGYSMVLTIGLVITLRETWVLNNGLFVFLAFFDLLMYAGTLWVAFTPNSERDAMPELAEEPTKGDSKYMAQNQNVRDSVAWRGGVDRKTQRTPQTAAPASANPQQRQARRVMDRLMPRDRIKFTRWDVLLMLVITLAYAVLGFYRLGDRAAAQTLWQPTKYQEGALIEFDQPYTIDQFWYYMEIPKGKVTLEFSMDGTNFSQPQKVNVADTSGPMDVFCWKPYDVENMPLRQEDQPVDEDAKPLDGPVTAKYVRILNTFAANLFEIGFTTPDGEIVQMVNATTLLDPNGYASGDAALLIDEQQYFYGVDSESFLHGTYFDEIYHVRTAYEQLHGIDIYETTHPPLGKVFISWGIQLFGMNPFGWRFMGTLVGVLMLPVMYAFAKVLFKKTKWAVLATAFLALDGMHLAQTRLATIDSYSVLWILAMYLFMYLYYYYGAVTNKWWRSILPLALAGICFGMGAASKWTCLYAGAGLAVIWALTMWRRREEYVVAGRLLQRGADLTPEQRQLLELTVKNTKKRVLLVLGVCVVFFLIVPIGIYIASYAPVAQATDLSSIWQMQLSMYNYHSTLDATHSFQSSWYSWPVVYRPMWLFSQQLSNGQVVSITTFGTPIIWWAGCAALLWGIWRWLGATFFGKAKLTVEQDGSMGYVIFGALAQLTPWLLVSRCVFIYHYFPTLPFTMLMLVYALQHIEKTWPKYGKWINLALVVVTVAMFVFFLAAWMGFPVSLEFSRYMRWMPSWYFYAGW